MLPLHTRPGRQNSELHVRIRLKSDSAGEVHRKCKWRIGSICWASRMHFWHRGEIPKMRWLVTELRSAIETLQSWNTDKALRLDGDYWWIHHNPGWYTVPKILSWKDADGDHSAQKTNWLLVGHQAVRRIRIDARLMENELISYWAEPAKLE